ncbi:YgaP family membrane protein [Pseudodesulfovibrio portus]|uniref:Sulfurtransferase n=1 Tax=Pseudodesulfovibrio portus TaxID=231439 RepID=A0ABN6RZ63_9BACT|nr:DUF2892 domain-containing protein [Pseudodesulfovibrio portus]BDQ34923.1 sulfurtransferase [Pseudodesulfovibrio portus]
MAERIVRGLAGFFVLVSLILAYFHSPYWLWFTTLVGANLLQSAVTGWCPALSVLKWMGVDQGRDA